MLTISRSLARSARSLTAKTKSPAMTQAGFISAMAAAQVSFDPSGVENKERLSSRLKEGRALVQNVWSIYRSFLITWAPFRIILLVLIALLRCSAASLPRDCINLGQGYMDFAPPSWVREAAEEALQSVSANHYSHPKGSLRLREALKRRYEADLGQSLDVETEILLTSGANQGRLHSRK